MKRKLILAAILLLAVIVTVLCACNGKNENTVANECLRIHIRANSNSDDDQSVKLKVRDELTAFFSTKLENCQTKGEAYATLQAAMPEIEKIAQSILEENYFDYGATVTLACEYFPDRQYDEYLFPKGNYDALVVGLGSAQGDNWWCVAFPPLCFVPNGDGEDITYKSWVKEIIDKIFYKS
ncbi:MAG TPA: stage II sporulation protein R [Clostridia bacterium]|nr:stage II sporulation protein R [Clostridia bacterium]